MLRSFALIPEPNMTASCALRQAYLVTVFHHRVRWERLRMQVKSRRFFFRTSTQGINSVHRLEGFTGNIEAPAPPWQLVDFMGEIICPTRPTRPHCLILMW